MTDFTTTEHLEELDAESKYLVHKAKEALAHAHASYSKFTVGAALLLEDGTVVTGANYENAAYPSGMCAERVALFAAAAQHPDKKIKKMAIVAKKKTAKELTPAASCGPCRQVMLEFEYNQRSNMEIVMLTHDQGWVKVPSAASLLPFSFTPDNLKSSSKS